MIRSWPSGVGGGATERLRTSPATVVGVAGVDVDAAHLDARPITSLTAASSPRRASLSTSERSKSMRPVPSALIWAPVTSVPGKRSKTSGVEHVGVGVQLGDPRAVVGVDPHEDVAGQRDLLVEHVPDDVVDGLDAGDRDQAAGVLDRADVADLAATAGMERRAVEGDPSGRRVDDRRAVLVQVRLLVTQVDGHGPNLSMVTPTAARSRPGTAPCGAAARPGPARSEASPTTTTVHGSR